MSTSAVEAICRYPYKGQLRHFEAALSVANYVARNTGRRMRVRKSKHPGAWLISEIDAPREA